MPWIGVLSIWWIPRSREQLIEKCWDADREVYQAVLENHEEWLDRYSAIPDRMPILLEVGDRQYPVLSHITDDGQTMLFISTNPGWPGSLMGDLGYLYTPTGAIPDDYQGFTFDQIDANIYCYRKK
jgi:hypothetical protein